MKILLTDDDVELREMVAFILESAGYEVSAHENGEKAWESLQKKGADMAVIDINMPKMDGLELMDLIRSDRRFKDMPIMIVTGRSDLANRTQSLERGADDYINKPFNNDEFLSRLKLLEQAFPKNA
jgi:DNA-binding response OmpR family regulator